MCLVTVILMKKMLNNWKHYWQEDSTEEKENSKVNYSSFVLIAMRLAIFLLGVHRRKNTKEMTNIKVEEMKTTNITKTKERSVTLLKKMILINMMMK